MQNIPPMFRSLINLLRWIAIDANMAVDRVFKKTPKYVILGLDELPMDRTKDEQAH